MATERFPADDPREWLNRARSNFIRLAVFTRYPRVAPPVEQPGHNLATPTRNGPKPISPEPP